MFKRLFNLVFNTDMGYKAIQYPYEYDGKRYIGYVLIKPYIIFGISGYDRINHFTDITSLNEFLGDDLVMNAEGWITKK